MSTNATGLSGEVYIDEDGLCQRIGVSKSTAQRFRASGMGPPFVKLGPGRTAAVRYRLSDVEAWLQANTFASTSAAKGE